MRRKLQRLKPAVSGRTLLTLAGLLWIVVGAMLLSFAVRWLRAGQSAHPYLLVAAGVIAALVIHHFGFLKVVDKNLGRILPMEGKRCVFSFMSWKSYLLVGLMMAMGIGLRHSPIPKPYLAVLYVGIGLALILSSIRYLRVVRATSQSEVARRRTGG
jgi:predicted histidine transporter YuiF (NhaC family)